MSKLDVDVLRRLLAKPGDQRLTDAMVNQLPEILAALEAAEQVRLELRQLPWAPSEDMTPPWARLTESIHLGRFPALRDALAAAPESTDG